MANSYNNTLRLIEMGNGDQSGTWGSTTNQNLATLLCEAITGVTSVALSSTTKTLTEYDGVTDESRNAVIEFTGTPGGNATVKVPDSSKLYIFKNSTTGGYTVTIENQTAGTSVVIPNGATMPVYTNGTNVYNGVDTLPSGASINGSAIVTLSATQTLTNKTLTSPTINGGTISGITDLAIADGGTGASTASDARDNLGLGTLATKSTITSADITNGTIVSEDLATGAVDTTNIADGAVTYVKTSFSGYNGYGARTVSTSDPSSGSNGDIWLKV